MNYLSANDLSKSFGTKPLFEGLTLGLSRGQKAALVGRNGCGKSTLLRILAGKESADSGDVSLRNGIRSAFLDQNPEFGTATTAFEAVFSGDDPRLSVVRRYEELQNDPNPDPDALHHVIDEMEAHKAWDYEAKVKEILGQVGISRLDQGIEELSGGQLKRLALARVLIQEPDLLILDEPTNHLDTDTIEWLEEYLASKNMTLILVTHDRYFLDRVCNEILEIEQGQVYRYEGDYEQFLEKKDERMTREDNDTSRARNLLRTELEWLRRQPKARGTKSKARIDAAHVLMEKAAAPVREGAIQLNFDVKRLGGKILELEHVDKSWDDLRLLDDFSYVFKKGERIGIVGPNGVGKTTFLDLITGLTEVDAGTISTGETVSFGYYRQQGLNFKMGQKVIDVITDAAEQISMGKGEVLGASAALTLFGFPPAMQYQPVDLLSGGEKRRLFLLRILMEQPNFLILDEPTNDLDIITLNTLEQFLMAFGGCLLIVSHDRYFLDKLCDQLFIFEGGGQIKPYNGNYRDYRALVAANKAAAKEAASRPAQPAPAVKQAPKEVKREEKRLSFKEQREYEGIEAEIAKLETRRSDLMLMMNTGSADFAVLQAWSEEIEQIGKQLEAMELRWLELAERAG
jgi:ABC transport system ATP-binding/permease protein